MNKFLMSFLSISLAVVLGVVTFSDIHARAMINQNNDTVVANSMKDDAISSPLFFETDVITQKDYEQGFLNYSQSVVDLSGRRRFIQQETANVVGVVKDYDHDTLISDATICVDEQYVITTDQDGRFQIKNMPSGKYDWTISAQGYYPSNYTNYDVDSADGTTIFTFYVSQTFCISKDRDKIIHDESCQMVPPDLIEKDNFSISQRSRSFSTVPNVRNNVNIYYNGSIHTVNRQSYIYTVLSSELYNASYYISRGLSNSQVNNLFCAQAIAANTFLEYSLSVYSNHSSYDVCSTTCCQAYDPTKVTQVAVDAAASIFYSAGGVNRTDIVMYKTTSAMYDYIWGAFFSSCGNSGTKSHSSQPALRAVSCSDLNSGYGGHRYGFCQMGAAKRAKSGNTASAILLYYYSNCCIASCPMN